MKCPKCGCEMEKVADSWADKEGNRYISYVCPHCRTVAKVKE